MKRVAVALSGGVDSSLSAMLLMDDSDNEVFGVTMNLHENSREPIESASRICSFLGIKHFVIDLQEAFKKSVIDVFHEYYRTGRTPNPCAFCNRDIKIGLFLEEAVKLGADCMATGHYAMSDNNGVLMEAFNKKKDQSYFLSLVKRENMKRMLFPLGKMPSKDETRRLALMRGLPNHSRSESQDVCFPTSISHYQYEDKEGDIIHIETQQRIGTHNGIHRYTIGQRRGLGIASKEPLFVARIDYPTNTIMVGERHHLTNNTFNVRETNWFIDKFTEEYIKVQVKLRSSCSKIDAQVRKESDAEAVVHLLSLNEIPVTAGQICAFYDGEKVVGAGIISF
ncbi:MAG: tRNA 2-thiouridine(34) synthase MnmA [Holosporales bacterium]|jgi:tRNA-specific 2-thiouridylase|nr:tRNA 2-thiouridine(34) synthase MnmA [Holosporales bacterium]